VSPENSAGGKLIVLFDGVCNFCNVWVQLIIRNDRKDIFRFASLQSEAGKKLLDAALIPASESVVLIENGKYYFHSSAALRISSHLNGWWKLILVFYIFPKFIRDAAYNFVARNRYKWFGKGETCAVPGEKVRHKFL
jgi:predicted DCC family thiol-disulfide oxidoreductase YuxK